MTLSGYSVEESAILHSLFAQNSNAAYLHICEGAPELSEGRTIIWLVN